MKLHPALFVAALPLLAHLLTAGNYGIFRDEYYYLACARHPAWGYVDQPPFSIAALALLRAAFGEGIWVLRVLPALCAGALVLLTARLASVLGGGRFAQVLAAICTAIVGVVQVTTGFYSMNAFDLVFWTAAWILVARWLAEATPRRWIELGVLLGFGLLNKIGLLVFGAALLSALLVSPRREVLRSRWPYLGAAIAVLITTPSVIWQAAHGWPTLEFIENAQRYKITAMPPLAFLGEIVLEQQPANLLVWTVGLGWLLFAGGGRRFRTLGVMFLIAMAVLMLQRSKPYYAAGLFPLLFAAGACAWEGFVARGRRAWLRPVLVSILGASGVFFIPLAFPVLSPEALARWQGWTGIAPASQEVGHTSTLPQYFSDRFGWPELAREVGRIAAALPDGERARAVVLAENYGQAGALDYWRDRYGIPPVYSGHNQYAVWLPPEVPLETVIAVGWSEEDACGAFEEVTLAGVLEHPWALENGLAVWLCRRPRVTWDVLRERIRFFI